MQFRPARPEDVPEMEQIYLQCVAEADWMPPESRACVNFAQDTHDEKMFVVTLAEGVAGFAAIWEPESFIHHLYVRSDLQGIGVGKKLLQGVAAEVPLPLRLKCLCTNHRARLFYLSQGWKIIEQGVSLSGPYWLMELAQRDSPGTLENLTS